MLQTLAQANHLGTLGLSYKTLGTWLPTCCLRLTEGFTSALLDQLCDSVAREHRQQQQTHSARPASPVTRAHLMSALEQLLQSSEVQEWARFRAVERQLEQQP